MLFSILNKIPLKGKIDIVDANDNLHSFGTSSPYVKIKLKNKSIERKLFFNPSLYLGEGYMDGEIILKNGNIEDLINITTSSYDNFILNNSYFNFYEIL